jgi:hypothetical protein
MIWHFFKKDWNLLWPFVAIVAAAHVINAVLWLMLGYFGEPREIMPIANIFPAAVFLGIGALIVTAVHQDALPGDRQDWLVRPIRRRDLILEKFLFVLVAVQGPMFLVDTVHCLATGFSIPDSLTAATSRNIYLLLIFSLPVLGLAAVTSTFVEAVGGFLAICLIVVLIRIGVIAALVTPVTPSFATMSSGWVLLELWSAVALATAAVVIPLQYFRRATMLSRAIALGGVLLLPVSALITWAPAFAFQQWLSADPAAAKAVVIAFDPNLGKLALRPGAANLADSVWLPLQVSGLESESIMLNDRAAVRIIARDGTILYRGLTTGARPAASGVGPVSIDDFPVRTIAGGQVRTHQLIALPHRIYELVRGQPVRVELDYSLSLFHIGASDTIAALNGDKGIANLGLCKTKIDDDGDEIEIGCKNLSPVTCGTFALKNIINGQQNPPTRFCNKYYPPITAHFIPNAMLNFGVDLHFRDPQGLAKYPVDSSQLANAQVLIKTYGPIAHFTRHLTIPEVRLGDWQAESRQAEVGANDPPS